MAADRWPPEQRDLAVLGVVVHGPALVARSAGIVMAVRCVVARPGVLELDLVLRAVDVQAEAAGRQAFGEHDPNSRFVDDVTGAWRGGPEPNFTIEINGRRAVAYSYDRSSGGGKDEFTSEMRVAVPELPLDGLVTLVASWPQAGLAEAAVTLTLDSLDDLENRVVRLLA